MNTNLAQQITEDNAIDMLKPILLKLSYLGILDILLVSLKLFLPVMAELGRTDIVVVWKNLNGPPGERNGGRRSGLCTPGGGVMSLRGGLHPDHLVDLQRSGLSDSTIERLAIRTIRPHDIKPHVLPSVESAYRLTYFTLEGKKNGFEAVAALSSPAAKRRPYAKILSS